MGGHKAQNQLNSKLWESIKTICIKCGAEENIDRRRIIAGDRMSLKFQATLGHYSIRCSAYLCAKYNIENIKSNYLLLIKRTRYIERWIVSQIPTYNIFDDGSYSQPKADFSNRHIAASHKRPPKTIRFVTFDKTPVNAIFRSVFSSYQ